MKINNISLYNFRQFYGEQNLPLSTDSQRNVTVIHAENGVGKTTLLNSVLWCFFNQVTSKFEQSESIVSFEALDEKKKEAYVEVDFDYEGTCYKARRTFNDGQKSKDSDFFILKTNSGVSRALDAPVSFINTVIPNAMAKYFFFDGEAAESFSAETNYRSVGKAIRNMLGCDLAVTAEGDLKYIIGKLNNVIATSAGDAEIERKEKELERYQLQLDEYKAKKDEAEDNVEALESVKDKIDKVLKENLVAKEIHLQRRAKEEELKEKKSDIREGRLNLVKWIGNYATSIVSEKLSKVTFDFIDEEELRGRIPSPYNEEFVRGLLSANKCICCRELIPESEEWKSVAALLDNATNAELLSRVTRARATIQYFRNRATDAPDEFENIQKRLARDLDKLSKLEQEIVELGGKIRNLDIDEITDQENARRQIDKEIGNLQKNIGQYNLIIKQSEKKIPSIENELTVLASKNKLVRKVFLRRQLATDGLKMLNVILQKYEATAREKITELVNLILEKTARKDYIFHFNDNFSIELLFSHNKKPVPKSGGENQILSLMFISALIKYSQSLIDSGDQILRPGTIAPLILDSPYGQLDIKYRASIAEYIPKMASQVVMLVSSSQGDETVMNVLRPYIGAEYILISENRGNRGNKSSDTIVLNGISYDRSLYNCDRNLTRIERVN